jgi:hypothetical protein
VVTIDCDTDAPLDAMEKHTMALLKGGGGDAIVLTGLIVAVEPKGGKQKKSKKS